MEDKTELIEKYYPFIKILARRISKNKPYLEYDDAVGDGSEALVNAIEQYDEGKKKGFKKYLSMKVNGYILDSIRQNSIISRSSLTYKKILDSANNELTVKLKREPMKSELAEYLEMDIHELLQLEKSAEINKIIFLDDEEYIFDESEIFSEPPDKSIMDKEEKMIIAKSISSLNKKERKVIYYYYYMDLNMKEISCYLNVTVGRVSQIHTNAIKKIRNYISKEYNGNKTNNRTYSLNHLVR